MMPGIRKSARRVKGPLVLFLLAPIKNDFRRLKQIANEMRSSLGISPIDDDHGFAAAKAAIIKALQEKDTTQAAELMLIESVRMTYEIDDHRKAMSNEQPETQQPG